MSKLGRKQSTLEEERKHEDFDNNKIIEMNETDTENYEDVVTETEEGYAKTNAPKRKKLSLNPRINDACLMKMHQILEDTEKEGMDNVVSWQPNDRYFVIHKTKEFAIFFLPRKGMFHSST